MCFHLVNITGICIREICLTDSHLDIGKDVELIASQTHKIFVGDSLHGSVYVLPRSGDLTVCRFRCFSSAHI